MGLQFHETKYGKRFFDHQLPELIKAIKEQTEVNKKILEVKISNQI